MQHSISLPDVIIGGDAVTRSASTFVSASILGHVTSRKQGKKTKNTKPFFFLLFFHLILCLPGVIDFCLKEPPLPLAKGQVAADRQTDSGQTSCVCWEPREKMTSFQRRLIYLHYHHTDASERVQRLRFPVLPGWMSLSV